MKNYIPAEALRQHIAFLGKTGSGKTSTAKLTVEQILRDDPTARVCVLDPIKSDWWGLTSSADGKKAGLPFYILGGPRGHVQLHETAGRAIGELVASGALPLSIIDMADFKPGGLQKFFNDFAPTLMKKMRGVVYLVIEEAHEFAPKERSGIGQENMAIHYAKRLATAGRSLGIRIMVVTQRTQALHNALLGSCDTMIAHRLTAPADQEPVKKWLKTNVDKEIYEKVSTSLAKLKTGSGWLCSGEAQFGELVQFPKISTYDNSATPTSNDAGPQVTVAPVDREHLQSIIGDAVKEAEDNDPALLKAEIARLKQNPTTDKAAVDESYQSGYRQGHQIGREASERYAIEAEQRGYERGFNDCKRQADVAYEALRLQAANTVESFAKNFVGNIGFEKIEYTRDNSFQRAPSPVSPAASKQPASAPVRSAITSSAASGDGRASPSVRKILDVIHRSSPVALSFDSAARRAAVSSRSSAYSKYERELEASREVVKRDDGKFTSAAGFAPPVGPGVDPIEEFASKMPPSYASILRGVAKSRRPLSREEIASVAGISPTSSGLGSGINEMIALGLFEKSGSRADERFWLHEDLRK